MPEINPLTNNQIFLKKIAENTGSDYETGDVSDINPLTIDQILLKEIAANTAGQSGDISELENKVADNTAAIEAIVNKYGACNLWNVENKVHRGVTFTNNGENGVSIVGTASPNEAFDQWTLMLPMGTYKVSGMNGAGSKVKFKYNHPDGTLFNVPADGIINDYIGSIILWVDGGETVNEVVYPMLYDARLKPTAYAPYSMTNEQLTRAVTEEKIIVPCDGVKTVSTILKELYDSVNLSKITPKSRLIFYDNGYQFSIGCSCILSNQLKFGGLLECNSTNLYTTSINMATDLATCLKYDTAIGAGGATITDGSAGVFSANGYFQIIY